MTDAREALEQHAGTWCSVQGSRTLTAEDYAPRAFDALRAVLDKCDALDQTGHLVAKAFAQDFRNAVTTALAGDRNDLIETDGWDFPDGWWGTGESDE